MQRGRRRAPFARSREGSAHIKVSFWRTEPVHGLSYRLAPAEGKKTKVGARCASPLQTLQRHPQGRCATLTHPTNSRQKIAPAGKPRLIPPGCGSGKTIPPCIVMPSHRVPPVRPGLRRNSEADFFKPEQNHQHQRHISVGRVSIAHPPFKTRLTTPRWRHSSPGALFPTARQA